MASLDDYKSVVKKMAPRGHAWPSEPTSLWSRLLNAISNEFFRVDVDARRLLREAFPGTTLELLPDWERVAGIPDGCAPLSPTIDERRKDLKARLTSRGGQSPQYFIDFAASIGYVITITEHDAFRASENMCGDPLNDFYMDFGWTVNAPKILYSYFRADSGACGEPLLQISSEKRLECAIRKRAPAHTVVSFRYIL